MWLRFKMWRDGGGASRVSSRNNLILNAHNFPTKLN